MVPKVGSGYKMHKLPIEAPILVIHRFLLKGLGSHTLWNLGAFLQVLHVSSLIVTTLLGVTLDGLQDSHGNSSYKATPPKFSFLEFRLHRFSNIE